MLSDKMKNSIKELIDQGLEYELRYYIDLITDSISIPWKFDDIDFVAEQMEVELTEEQKNQVLLNLAENFDAEVGINWNVLEYEIRNIVSDS